jgi:hypothetical protein
MFLKKNVKIQGLTPEILLAIMIVNEVYKSYSIEFVITSVTDSKHTATNSLHYSGNAFDCRTSNIPVNIPREMILNDIKEALGPNFYVLDEKSHFHISYKPIYIK